MNKHHEYRIIGPPGTGKTRFLETQIAYDAQARGSDNVVALSHTRAAAAVIASRDVPLPPENIGTLHSLAFRALGCPTVVEDAEHLKTFADEHPAWPMSASYAVEDLEVGIGSNMEGDNLLAEYARRRNLMEPREQWPHTLAVFADAWEAFKADCGGIDFTDMIELALFDTEGPASRPQVLIADEGQDLSRLQYTLLRHWAAGCDKFVLALDPDQSIYDFAGADPLVFMENPASEQKVLRQSYRVPGAVHQVALRWIRRITRREQFEYDPTPEPGRVAKLPCSWEAPENILIVALERALGEGKTVMFLTSCSYMLTPLIMLLRKEGIPFANPFRRKNGAWNPLHYGGRGRSTVSRIASFLAPFEAGANRLWTAEQLHDWMGLVKGCFVRGGKSRLEQLSAQTSEADVLDNLIGAFASSEELAQVMGGPPGCLDWLAAHLGAGKAKPAEYVMEVIRRRGLTVALEEPRLCLGTIHSVKGGEADVVFLCPDLSRQGMDRWASTERDSVIRQYYVGMTRAKHELYFLDPADRPTISGYYDGA